jgi:hypothetical protein
MENFILRAVRASLYKKIHMKFVDEPNFYNFEY